jgi:hypothetical protein
MVGMAETTPAMTALHLHYGDTPAFTCLFGHGCCPMTRMARIVAPGLPHHVTRRGNRAETTVFEPEDYRHYRDWLAESRRRFGVACSSLLPDAPIGHASTQPRPSSTLQPVSHGP